MASLPSVLFSASECAPLAKTGGLGDVVGALPIALRARGHDARVILPRYAHLDTHGMHKHPAPLAVPLGGGEAWCGVWETRLPGSDVPVYLLEHDALFARGYIYGHPADQLLRWSLLSRGTLALCRYLGWTPDVLHVHDWHTSLVPLFLNTVEKDGPQGRCATVLTIHNLAHQGLVGKELLPDAHVPWSEFRPDSLEDHGAVNLLKGGLYHATMLTTVSPTYAREIRTPEFGCGLAPVLNLRGADLVGVLNGIDERVWDPRSDPFLPERYGPETVEAGKAACKRALQHELHLPARDDLCLVAMVARLSRQKGVDVLVQAAERILSRGVQLVVLGNGDDDLQHALREMNVRFYEELRASIVFDEGLAHRIEAGADLFLMPSRFEPCGLSQMYSQRYGTLPVVRATGGLDDTVQNFVDATGEGTGFKFHDLSAWTLEVTVGWAVDAWRHRRQQFRAAQVRAMQKPQGWDGPAAKYGEIYRWAIERRRG